MPFPPWALDALVCPHCRGALEAIDDRSAVIGCAAGHRFDVAKQGYLPLLGAHGRTDTGDSAAMVAARERLLSAGYYAPIVDAVAGAVADVVADVVVGVAANADEYSGESSGAPAGAPASAPIVELGAGTGYYLAAAAARTGQPGLAIDSSKYALRRAARLAGIAAVLADAWSALPLRDSVAAAVLSIFAPRDPAEVLRILAPGGVVVVVTPDVDHLRELREPLGLLAVDAGKAVRVVEALSAAASSPRPTARPPDPLPLRVTTTPVRAPLALPREAAVDVALMGPAARHHSAAEIAARAAALPATVDVTIAVTVTALSRPRCG